MEDHERWKAEADTIAKRVIEKLDPCFAPTRKPKWAVLDFAGNRHVQTVTIEADLGEQQPLFDGARIKEILNAEFDPRSTASKSVIDGSVDGDRCELKIISRFRV